MHDISSEHIVLFAPMLRVARAILGISQGELAKCLGLTQRAIHKLESGTVSPRPKTTEAIKVFFSTTRLSFEAKDGVVNLLCPLEIFAGLDRKPALAGQTRRKFKQRFNKNRKTVDAKPSRRRALGH
ncbi:MAG: helix-turn-helix transcriptional regulator [Xanthobacteraceae bacterium]|uniref:helix-turn-helix transcriptional regulator n=1 Tax=Pseudolabrys sp. TaxID=1960880 RepID=UPI003D0E9E1D